MYLQDRIEELFDTRVPARTPANLALLAEFRAGLNRGELRSVLSLEERWVVNVWVSKGILLHAALGLISDFSQGCGSSFELDTMPLRRFVLEDQVRIIPGGSTIRDGAYLAPRVSCVAPVFINLGAHIGSGTILDSHTSIGFCAQIGERVHVGPGTQIGGVLEPHDRLPVILGDDVVIGGNCGIYDGVCVGKGAILAAGTILTGTTRVFDVKNRRYFKGTRQQPLFIPPNAIVIPGTRPIQGAHAAAGLMLPVGVLAGYRDDPELREDLLEDLLG